MTTSNTQVIAKVAAVLAGLGLIVSSFAVIAPAHAQTTTTTTTTSTSSVTFTRDLTIGSTGADVTALQAWLIGKGFAIPAGATGYFGMQTKAAVAAFQAANHITPAAGYFGPITRAAVNSMAGGSSTGSTGGSTGSTGGSTSGGLSGGEAQLRNFNLVAGSDLSSGDTNQEIAVARFDVRSGDARIQRVTVEMTPTSASYNQHPWNYIDTLSVYNGSKKVGSIDASSKDSWDRITDDSAHAGSFDYYSIDIPVNTIVKAGDTAELSIRADAQSSINTSDLSQTFKLDIPDNGIRAVDAAGIQDYAGQTSKTVTVALNAQQNGQLVVTTSSNNPKAQVLVADTKNTSDSFDVLSFDIRNKDNTDVDFNKLTFSVATSSASGSPASSITSIIRRATLDLDGNTYTGTVNSNGTITFDNLNTSVGSKSTITGTLSVELFGQTNHFAASGESLTFTLTGNTTNVDAESTGTGNSATVTGSAAGKKMSIGTNVGIQVAGNSNSTSESYNSTNPLLSTGTFMLKFDVTGNGNSVYIPKSVAAVSSTTVSQNGVTPATAGVVVITDLAGSTTSSTVSASLNSSADTDPDNSGYYLVRDGETKTFTVNVTIDPTASGYYQIGLDMIHFTDVSTGGSLQVLDVDQNDSAFQTQQQYIH